MKVCQVLALCALVVFTTIGAHADGVSDGDARIIVGSSDPPHVFLCGLPNFNVKVPKVSHGGFFQACINAGGEDWIGLKITGTAELGKIIFGPGTPCDGTTFNPFGPFGICNAVVTTDTKNKKESVTLTLSDGEIFSDEPFFINLFSDGDPFGKNATKGGWIGVLTFTPITAPEPETMTLFLIGLGCIWSLRKRHDSKSNA